MSASFTPKLVARLVFYPVALIALAFIFTMAAVSGHWLFNFTQEASVFVFMGGLITWYAVIVALVVGYAKFILALRKASASIGLLHQAGKLLESTSISAANVRKADQLFQLSDKAEWSMLTGMASLLLLFASLMPSRAHAGTYKNEPLLVSNQESGELERALGANAQQIELARQLQIELHLNEHGFIRALKYLRQGYSETEVRNLFAAVVLK